MNSGVFWNVVLGGPGGGIAAQESRVQALALRCRVVVVVVVNVRKGRGRWVVDGGPWSMEDPGGWRTLEDGGGTREALSRPEDVYAARAPPTISAPILSPSIAQINGG